MMYNKVVEDCFFRPRHVGIIAHVPGTAQAGCKQKGQNLAIDLYLQCGNDKIINKACFKAIGNPYVIAALEWLCRTIEGTDIEKQPLLNYEILVQQLEMPTNQYPVALQIEGVYKEALALLNAQFKR